MTKIPDTLPATENMSPVGAPFFYFFILLLGIFLAQFLGFLTVIPFIGFDIEAITKLGTDPSSIENGQALTLLLQSVYSIFAYIVIPLVYVVIMIKAPAKAISPEWKFDLVDVALAAAILFPFLIVNASVIEWNANLHLPEALSSLDAWMHKLEDQMAEQTEFLTQMDGIGDLIMVSFVIAVLPAIGEEIAFRGVLQGLIQRASGNAHIAVWVSAFVFSAIHMQFLGFFPRVMLGALFGYLFVWSGRLWVAMLAHFFNNFFMVLLVYGQQHSWIEDTTDSPEQMGALATVIAAVALIGLCYIYWKYHHTRRNKA